MAHDSSPPNQEKSLQGTIIRPASDAELYAAVEQAFDYRGDVTLELKSGESVVGYVFSRETGNSHPYLNLFPTDKPGSLKVLYADIASIAFSGKDTAYGQSWEAWIQKKREEGKK